MRRRNLLLPTADRIGGPGDRAKRDDRGGKRFKSIWSQSKGARLLPFLVAAFVWLSLRSASSPGPGLGAEDSARRLNAGEANEKDLRVPSASAGDDPRSESGGLPLALPVAPSDRNNDGEAKPEPRIAEPPAAQGRELGPIEAPKDGGAPPARAASADSVGGDDAEDGSNDDAAGDGAKQYAEVLKFVRERYKSRIPNESALPPLPEDVARATRSELKGRYRCGALYATTRPPRSASDWMLMRGIYWGLFGPSVDDGGAERNDGRSTEALLSPSSVVVPYVVRESPGKGRGIFAAEDVPEGALVYTAAKGGHFHFETGRDFRRYLHSLPSDEMACEVLQCSSVDFYYSRFDVDEPWTHPRLSVDLNDGCFVNSIDDGEEANLGCPGDMNETACDMAVDDDWAVKDIRKGEELLMDYSDYGQGHWSWFGL